MKEETKKRDRAVSYRGIGPYLLSVWGVTGGLVYGPFAREWLLSRGIEEGSASALGTVSGMAVSMAAWWLLHAAWLRAQGIVLAHKVSTAQMNIELKKLGTEGDAIRFANMTDRELRNHSIGSAEYNEYKRRNEL